MTRLARFILALIVGLALLMWAVSGIVQSTAENWFVHDVRSRAQLALTGERQSLADAWNDSEKLNSLLEAFARGDRVMGAAACDADLSTRLSTPGFPEEFGCSKVGSRIRASDPRAGEESSGIHEWSTVHCCPLAASM